MNCNRRFSSWYLCQLVCFVTYIDASRIDAFPNENQQRGCFKLWEPTQGRRKARMRSTIVTAGCLDHG